MGCLKLCDIAIDASQPSLELQSLLELLPKSSDEVAKIRVDFEKAKPWNETEDSLFASCVVDLLAHGELTPGFWCCLLSAHVVPLAGASFYVYAASRGPVMIYRYFGSACALAIRHRHLLRAEASGELRLEVSLENLSGMNG